MRILSVPILVLLLTHPAAGADEEARAIVERAIKAAGGADQLSRLRQVRARVKGSSELHGRSVTFTATIVLHLPGRYKNDARIVDAGRTLTLITVVNGDRAWTALDGTTQPLDGTALEERKEEAYASEIELLTPLLDGKRFTLTALGEGRRDDRRLLGIRVAARGHKDLELYVDQSSHLLVRVARAVRGPDGKEVRQESVYNDFRDVGGLQHPHKMRIDHDGKKHAEMEIVELRLLERIDAGEFAKP